MIDINAVDVLHSLVRMVPFVICHLAVPLYPLQMCAMVDIFTVINADDVVHLLILFQRWNSH